MSTVSSIIFEPRNAPTKRTQLGQSGSTSILASAHLQNQTASSFWMILLYPTKCVLLQKNRNWSGPKSRKGRNHSAELTKPRKRRLTHKQISENQNLPRKDVQRPCHPSSSLAWGQPWVWASAFPPSCHPWPLPLPSPWPWP